MARKYKHGGDGGGRARRKTGTRTAKADSYLIVTEGEETEPNYFKDLKERIGSSRGENITVRLKPVGRGTSKLIDAAEGFLTHANVVYQNVWLVFDKDIFGDFDQTIVKAQQKGYHVAWTNSSFEYWLCLYFHNETIPLHRKQWEDKLDATFRSKGISPDGYKKNMSKLYTLVSTYGNQENAFKFAERRCEETEGEVPSKRDPCTTVHVLVRELLSYINE